MSDAPWLTILGLGEDGPDGLTPIARAALDAAEVIMAPPRHLALVGETKAQMQEWPVPFADGLPLLLAHQGKQVVVLASGDPFWYGAGTTLSKHLDPHEWRCFPGASVFAMAANRMGWPIETTSCLGLHAAPLARLRANLAPGARIIATLRDGAAVLEMGAYVTAQGFGPSDLTVLEALGGPRERVTHIRASALNTQSFAHPVCVACQVQGTGATLPLAAGRPDDWFDNDGQITKRPIRALTISSLAPMHGDHLWDIGGGSGSIAIEWLLAHPSLTATCFEQDVDRAARITANAAKLGVDRLMVVSGGAPEVLTGQRTPNVVFVGGGLSARLLEDLQTRLARGTRLVANAVTLESEALLLDAHAQLGGDLLRIETARAHPIGPKRGWKASYPIVQWSVTL